MRLFVGGAVLLLLASRPAFAGIGFDQLKLWSCGASPNLAPFQGWDYDSAAHTIRVRTYKLWGGNSGWNTVGPAVVNASLDSTTGCGLGQCPPPWTLQIGAPSTQITIATGLCAAVVAPLEGSGLWLQPCISGDTSQAFSVSVVTGRIVHVASGLCVDAGNKNFYSCRPGSPGAALPFCNASLGIDARVADLLPRLSLFEKAAMLDTSSGGAPGVGVPPIQWWTEGLHGVADNVGAAFVDPTPYATSFPQPITTSSAFNRSLWRAVGATVSTEARAFANAGHAGLMYWAPNINIFRDPRWGRGQETPGEDPFLSAAYAEHFVLGMQAGDDPRYLKTSACCKHFAAYSLELWQGMDRHHFNAVVPDADLVDVYLPAFQACVQSGAASSMMCSYNAVNGVPSCANDFLLTTVARQEWGFDGYITSDCGAVTDVLENHKYTANDSSTVAATLNAGMDIGCDDFLAAAGRVQAAQAEGLLAEGALDGALGHLLRVRMRLGTFDDPAGQPYATISTAAVCTPEALALARDAAAQGIVMLHNDVSGAAAGKGALPLARAAVASVAVVGPVANASITNGGPNYAGVPCGGGAVTVLQALQAAAPAMAVAFAPGCADVACAGTDGFAAAAAAAAAADLTVVVVGIDQTVEDEGLDRVAVTLPGQQNALVSGTCAAARGPCVLVLLSGGSQDLSALLPSLTAAFYAGFPGGNGALALVDMLFGDVVPAGRLTQTFYGAAFVDEVSMFEMGVRPGPSAFPPGSSPGRTYQFYAGAALAFPFGFGSSAGYTTWRVTNLTGPAAVPLLGGAAAAYLEGAAWGAAYAPLGRGAPLLASYSVNVTNTGARDAAYVVLGFLVPPGAGAGGVPLQTLFGFERVWVPAGQSVTVWLGVTARDLTAAAPIPAGHALAAPGALPRGAPRVVRAPRPGTWGLRIGGHAAAPAAARWGAEAVVPPDAGVTGEQELAFGTFEAV